MLGTRLVREAGLVDVSHGEIGVTDFKKVVLASGLPQEARQLRAHDTRDRGGTSFAREILHVGHLGQRVPGVAITLRHQTGQDWPHEAVVSLVFRTLRVAAVD